MFYGEYLRAPKHNTLKYIYTPKNHIALYGVDNQHPERIKKQTNGWENYSVIKNWSDHLGIGVVPLLFQGQVNTIEELKENLNRTSILGGAKIEGFVVKNYNEQLLIGGQVIPILMGKYVSEEFKEVHNKEWKSENTGKGRWEVYKSQFCNTARWHKAIQFLRDSGFLQQSPKDIGMLLKRISLDIEEEEKENIKDFLWNEFGKEVLREAVKGFPQYYKEYLLEKGFDTNAN
jgi:hypothetical protein